MVKHICHRCERNFKQKGHLIDHLNKKNRCEKKETIITTANETQKTQKENNINEFLTEKTQNPQNTHNITALNFKNGHFNFITNYVHNKNIFYNKI